MDVQYNKQVITAYLKDIHSLQRTIQQHTDTRLNACTECLQNYTRFIGEVDEKLAHVRRLLSDSECEKAAIETQIRNAKAEMVRDANTTTVQDGSDHMQSDLFRMQAQYSQIQRQQTNLATANARLTQLKSKLDQLMDRIGNSLQVAVSQVHTGKAELLSLITKGNTSLDDFCRLMEKGRQELSNSPSLESSGAVPSTEAPSTTQDSSAASSPDLSHRDKLSQPVRGCGSCGYSDLNEDNCPAGWCINNSMTSVHLDQNGEKAVNIKIGNTVYQYPCTQTDLARAYRQALKIGDRNAAEKIYAMHEIEVFRRSLDLGKGDPAYPQLGGYYRDVTKAEPSGYEAHHIPAQSTQSEKKQWLPTIAISLDDHKNTTSYTGKQNHRYTSFMPSESANITYKQSVINTLHLGCTGYIAAACEEVLDLRCQTGHTYDGGISAYLDAVIDMLSSYGVPKAR